jgi:hypothetical protein
MLMERTLLYLISQHRVKGWMIIKYWYFQDRALARQVESEVLKILRNKLSTVHLKKEEMPQHGYTETFSTKTISSKEVISIINNIINNNY